MEGNIGGRLKESREEEEEEEEEMQWGGAMGGKGAVKLSTQFTQTALSARVEAGRRRKRSESAGPDRAREEGRWTEDGRRT